MIQIPPKIIAQLARAMQAETIVAGEVMIRTGPTVHKHGTRNKFILDDLDKWMTTELASA